MSIGQKAYSQASGARSKAGWVWLVLWALCAVGLAMTWNSKAGIAFLVGFILGPFGILFALQKQTQGKRCALCKAPVHADEAFCPDCEKARAGQTKAADRERIVRKRFVSDA